MHFTLKSLTIRKTIMRNNLSQVGIDKISIKTYGLLNIIFIQIVLTLLKQANVSGNVTFSSINKAIKTFNELPYKSKSQHTKCSSIYYKNKKKYYKSLKNCTFFHKNEFEDFVNTLMHVFHLRMTISDSAFNILHKGSEKIFKKFLKIIVKYLLQNGRKIIKQKVVQKLFNEFKSMYSLRRISSSKGKRILRAIQYRRSVPRNSLSLIRGKKNSKTRHKTQKQQSQKQQSQKQQSQKQQSQKQQSHNHLSSLFDVEQKQKTNETQTDTELFKLPKSDNQTQTDTDTQQSNEHLSLVFKLPKSDNQTQTDSEQLSLVFELPKSDNQTQTDSESESVKQTDSEQLSSVFELPKSDNQTQTDSESESVKQTESKQIEFAPIEPLPFATQVSLDSENKSETESESVNNS
jgi:hypothetical protein